MNATCEIKCLMIRIGLISNRFIAQVINVHIINMMKKKSNRFIFFLFFPYLRNKIYPIKGNVKYSNIANFFIVINTNPLNSKNHI